MDNETLEFLISTLDLQLNLQSSYDEYEEIDDYNDGDYDNEDDDDDDDDEDGEFQCSYCSESLDIVELCLHIEAEHYDAQRFGLCPVCATRVKVNMITHITNRHGNILNIQRKLKLLIGQSNSALYLALRKELQDEHLRCLLEASASNMVADPLLSSFICNMPTIDESTSVQSSLSTESSLAEDGSNKTRLERSIQSYPLSDKDQENNAQKNEFVQGLLWSTFFDHNL